MRGLFVFSKSPDGASVSRGGTLKKQGRAEEQRVQGYAGRQVQTEADRAAPMDASALFSFD